MAQAEPTHQVPAPKAPIPQAPFAQAPLTAVGGAFRVTSPLSKHPWSIPYPASPPEGTGGLKSTCSEDEVNGCFSLMLTNVLKYGMVPLVFEPGRNTMSGYSEETQTYAYARLGVLSIVIHYLDNVVRLANEPDISEYEGYHQDYVKRHMSF